MRNQIFDGRGLLSPNDPVTFFENHDHYLNRLRRASLVDPTYQIHFVLRL